MKTTININGKSVEIELTADQVAKIKKESTLITERIKTFQDVLDYHGISSTKFKNGCVYLDEQEIANRQVKLIALALNEGVEMNAFDEDQYKYYPYFEVQENGFVYDSYGTWGSHANVGSRLCFKTADLAIYAGKTFIDIYTKLLS